MPARAQVPDARAVRGFGYLRVAQDRLNNSRSRRISRRIASAYMSGQNQKSSSDNDGPGRIDADAAQQRHGLARRTAVPCHNHRHSVIHDGLHGRRGALVRRAVHT